MTPVEILQKQTQSAYALTNKLIGSIPYDHWNTIPPVADTSVTWQVGHLIMSFYFHSIMVISGHQPDILQKIPLREYDTFFTDASPELSQGKFAPEILHEQLMVMEQKSMSIIGSLSTEDLDSPLHPSPIKNPMADTKFEALDWNIKHTLWHCGQIGMLKRIVHERYNFGLKRA